MLTPTRQILSPIRLVAVLVASALLSACTSGPAITFTAAKNGPVWPSPPDEPRVRFIGALVSAADAPADPNRTRSLGEVLFGKDTPRGMVSPIGVCTNGLERVFVVDSGAALVHVFDLDTGNYQAWTPGEGAEGFKHPVAAVYDAARSRLIVADAGAGLLRCFGADGRVTATLAHDILKQPCGLAIHPTTGNIYVADVREHKVVVISPTGVELNRLGVRGSGLGEFNFPTFVAFDAQANLYVADSLNFRIQVFDPVGKFIRQIGRKGDMPGYFSQPKGIAIDPSGNLSVVDANFEAVQIFDNQGTLLMPFGHEGREPGEFWLPAGICIDAKGRAMVADNYNRRIQIFQYLTPRSTP